MPFMQRITWSGVADARGCPAGLSCLAWLYPPDPQFASELWGMTGWACAWSWPEDVQPVTFAHPALPTPTLTPRLRRRQYRAGEVCAVDGLRQ